MIATGMNNNPRTLLVCTAKHYFDYVIKSICRCSPLTSIFTDSRSSVDKRYYKLMVAHLRPKRHCITARIMLAVILVLSVAVLSIWILSTPKKKLPPGPRGKPFIGVLTELDTNKMHQQLVDCTHKYGRMFSFKVFGTVNVVMNDEKLLREAYSSGVYANLFNDRPDTFFGNYVLFNYSDVAFAKYDDATTKLRKALHKGLHSSGHSIKQ